MLKAGFRAGDGWEKRIWRRTLTLTIKKKEVTAEHVRPYLIHVETGVVITVQRKASMDTSGIIMWLDVQFGPWMAKRTKRALLVWDNCGPHKVAAVRKVMEEWNIRAEELPPKMTDHLQVMDLVVNGLVKAGIRRARIDALFNFMQSWKIERLQHIAKKDGTAPPEFRPPKPTQADGLLCLYKVVKENLQTPKFKESMSKCFVQVGLVPNADGEFVTYSPTKKGALANIIPQTMAHENATSVGEVMAELAVTTRSPINTVSVDEDGEITDIESDAHSSDEEHD